MNSPATQGPDIKNLIFAILAATAIMFGWQYFYERPRQLALHAQQQMALEKQRAEEARNAPVTKPETSVVDATAGAPRITINTPSLHGSISVVGARFDDITLANYRETLEDDATEVKLLAQSASEHAYFIELGVLGESAGALPGATTRWQADSSELTPEKPVTLRWNNGSGLAFERRIAVDDQFMFTVTTTVKNSGASAVTLYPYGLISRNHEEPKKNTLFIHEGPLGVMNNVLEDLSYKKLRENGVQKFADASGWVGMTDKYWLTAIIPENSTQFDAEYKHFNRGEYNAYQSDMRAKALNVAVGESQEITVRVFAGAKVGKQLDVYRDQYSIPLFDRAVDFGTLYFIAKPMFDLLHFFWGIVGNFGVAILLLTVVIKALLFPLANKSMTAMARMKLLMPKMTEIRERFKDDKMKMNTEIMAMYKREKVNPAAGCLPILLQIPVFFALYRVLLVSIEMRHAPFFGWIHDLSVVDPTNIFTLFGLLPWATPGFLHIGVWPLIMCVTMVIQHNLNPKPADEIQAMMMKWMPYMFLFMFATFPAGLVIYWAWNNTLTIFQQLYINSRLEKKGLKEKTESKKKQ